MIQKLTKKKNTEIDHKIQKFFKITFRSGDFLFGPFGSGLRHALHRYCTAPLPQQKQGTGACTPDHLGGPRCAHERNLALLMYHFNDLCFTLVVCVSICVSLDLENPTVFQNLRFR